MSEGRRARVGLLGLTLELYQLTPGLFDALENFGKELAGKLGEVADVDFPHICYKKDQILDVVSKFENDDADLLIVVLLSYSPSLTALPALLKTRLPILILNTQELLEVPPTVLSWETSKNHGMHGVQDLTNILIRSGRDFHIITGHYLDPDLLNEIKCFCDAAMLAKWLKTVEIGQIGYSMQDMGDFAVDESAFLNQLGVRIHHLSMREIQGKVEKVSEEVVHKNWLNDSKLFDVEQGTTEDEYAASERLTIALRETLKQYKMAGFASHFTAIGEEGILETLPFLAASKLLSEGYGFGGEGDVTSATLVALMSKMAGCASFTEMFTMDFVTDSVLMMHMGEANPSIAREDEKIRMMRSTLGLVNLKVAPMLLAFSYMPGEVTLASLTTTVEGRLKIIATEGEILDFPSALSLGRPHGKFKPDTPLSTFLTDYSLEGGSHHLALVYGSYTKTLELLCELLGIEFALV